MPSFMFRSWMQVGLLSAMSQTLMVLSDDPVTRQSGHCDDNDMPLIPSECAFSVHNGLSSTRASNICTTPLSVAARNVNGLK